MTPSEPSIDLIAALQALNEKLSQYPNADAFYQRGRIHAKLNQVSAAIADYSKSIRLSPTAEALLQRALLYLSEGNLGQAIADAQRAIQIQPSAMAYRLLGKAYAQQGKRSEAIAAYKQAAQGYLKLADKENARFCLEQIQALPPAQPSIVLLPPSRQFVFNPVTTADFLQKIQLKVEQGQHLDAQSDLNWLLNLEPNQTEALCLLSKIHAKLGDASAAIATITKAQQLDPQNRAIQVQRGIVRSLLGDAHGAIADFTQLIQQDSSNADLYLQRAQCHGRAGDWENAFKDYSNAIGILPQNPAAYFARAAVQQEMDELDGSIADYQQAASIWFDRGDATNHQKALAQANALRDAKKTQSAAKAAAEAAIIRVPIKYRISSVPVIEAVFNDRYTFDLMLDTGASRTLISRRMAHILGIQPTGRTWGRVADGRYVEFDSGWVQSIAVGAAIAHDLQVMIADSEVEGLLGQDFLGGYHVRLLADVVEFYR